MFKKPFRIKTQSTMKGSDRKKLRIEVLKNFIDLKEDIVAKIIPSKEEVTMVKVHTHGGDNLFIYCVEKNPILFHVDKEKLLYPTVYLLWQYPDLVPRFTTWPPVFSKLVDGADLMLPGLVLRGVMTPNTFSNIRKGETCSVSLLGNRAAVAVGYTMLSGSDMFYAGMKGKGVHPLHTLGDELWAFGDRSKPPDFGDDPPPLDEAEGEEVPEGAESAEEASASNGAELPVSIVDGGREEPSRVDGVEVTNDGGLTLDRDMSGLSVQEGIIKEGQDDLKQNSQGASAIDLDYTDQQDVDYTGVGETSSKEKMDDLLYFCFLCALKNSVKKSDLPLLTRVFYLSHMMPFCPEGSNLDIKKSSYKKLSKFLQKQEQSGFITVKETSKGVDSIVEIDRTHEELRGFVAPEPCASHISEGRASPEFRPPHVTELYGVTTNLLPLFKPLGYGKTTALSNAEVRAAVTEYIKSNDLQLADSKTDVQLDPVLAEVVLTKSENHVTTMKWDAVFSRTMNKMQPVFQIDVPGQPPVIRKGKVEPISIDVHQRASNKKVTLVDNLEAFGIDPKEFAHAVQVKVACSGSVNPSAQKGQGLQVLVQGNQVSCVADLLLNKYQIPRKYIRGFDKAPKKSKRK